MSRRRFVENYKLQNDVENDEALAHLNTDEADGFSTAQFYQQPKEKIPWKTLFFIAILFTMGTICLSFGLLISIGLLDDKYADRSLSLTILGGIMLIPGGYYTYILISIYFRREGYGVHLIPSL